ncbi:integrase, partial (plasmid) [Coxiella burnetii]
MVHSLKPIATKNTLVEEGSDYVHAATSENTRLAYRADIQHFLSCGHTLPTTP